MPLIRYRDILFRGDRQRAVEHANAILREYAAQGYDLTLRQVFYQFVSRNLFPDERKWTWTGSRWARDPQGTKNAEPNYKWLGDVLDDGRLAGLVDWDHIVDRTRSLRERPHWESPGDIVAACARQFRVDKWARQGHRVECWIEKDALIGVIERVANELDIPCFSCRGYTSQSAMWAAAQRLLEYRRGGQAPVILHLGDHDPSGIDMSRDIQDRLREFTRERVVFHRLALNMPQIEALDPPPSPAKLTDARCRAYVEEFGEDSWELDALDPPYIARLVREAVARYRNEAQWAEDAEREREMRRDLQRASSRWDAVVDFLRDGPEDEPPDDPAADEEDGEEP